MRVVMVEPGYAPYEKEVNGLTEMQTAVGGLIQAIYPFEERVGIVCNEEGLINGMEFNRKFERHFYINGVLLPGYTVSPPERSIEEVSKELLGFLRDCDLPEETPPQAPQKSKSTNKEPPPSVKAKSKSANRKQPTHKKKSLPAR